MLITSTFRIYLFRSIVRLVPMPRDIEATQNRSLREIYVNPRVKRGRKKKWSSLTQSSPTHCRKDVHSFSCLPILFRNSHWLYRWRNRGLSLHEKDSAACNDLPYVHTLFEGKGRQRHGGELAMGTASNYYRERRTKENRLRVDPSRVSSWLHIALLPCNLTSPLYPFTIPKHWLTLLCQAFVSVIDCPLHRNRDTHRHLSAYTSVHLLSVSNTFSFFLSFSFSKKRKK